MYGVILQMSCTDGWMVRGLKGGKGIFSVHDMQRDSTATQPSPTPSHFPSPRFLLGSAGGGGVAGGASVSTAQHSAAQMLLHCLERRSPDQPNWELRTH